MAIMLEPTGDFAHFLHKFNKVLKNLIFFENFADFLTLLWYNTKPVVQYVI